MHVEFLVEELSAKKALDILLLHLFPADGPHSFETYSLESKTQMLDALPARLRDYASMMRDWADLRVVVLLDRDEQDCRALKLQLETLAASAGLTTKAASASTGRFQVVNRVVCEELEAWYLGDEAAVTAAYDRVHPHHFKVAYATLPQPDPDAVRGGTWEAFQRVLAEAGYEAPRTKQKWAERIAPHLDPARNQSASFQCFWLGVQALLAQGA